MTKWGSRGNTWKCNELNNLEKRKSGEREGAPRANSRRGKDAWKERETIE